MRRRAQRCAGFVERNLRLLPRGGLGSGDDRLTAVEDWGTVLGGTHECADVFTRGSTPGRDERA